MSPRAALIGSAAILALVASGAGGAHEGPPKPPRASTDVFVDLALEPPPLIVVEPGTGGFTLRFRHAALRATYRVTLDSSMVRPKPIDMPPVGDEAARFNLGSTCDELRAEAARLVEVESEPAMAEAFRAFEARARTASSCSQAAFLLDVVERAVNRSTHRSFSATGGEQIAVLVERLDPGPPVRVARSWRSRVVVRDPDARWPEPTEEAWLVGQTARRVTELSAFAAGRPSAKSSEVTVRAAGETKGGAPRYDIRLSVSEAAGSVVLEPHLWSPRAWAALAGRVLGPARPVGVGATLQVDREPLEALLDLRAPIVAAAAHGASRRLAAAPADPVAHEQAALVLAAFILRESAGPFSNVRPTLARMAAHLAVAEALSPERSPAGRLAEVALLVLVGRQADASQALDRARADSSAAVQAWGRALAVRNTGDWRLIPRPREASLLERLELFRALTSAFDAARAAEIVGPDLDDVADWNRIAIQEEASVEEGHEFLSSAGKLELEEARTLYQATQARELAPEQYVRALNESPGEAVVGPGAQVPVLEWADWAEFLRRHLLSALDANSEFLIRSLYWKEAGDAFNRDAERRLGDLRGFVFVRRRSEERLRAVRNELDRDWPAFCAEVSRAAGTQPEQLSPFLWFEAQVRCQDSASRIPALGPWFTPRLPYGTAFDVAARFRYVHAVPDARTQLADALALAPHSEDVVSTYLRSVIAPLSPDEAARLADPLLDHRPRVAVAYLKYLERQPGQEKARREVALRLCRLVAERCSEAGEAFEAAGEVDLAAAAYERLFEKGRSAVAASHYATWLVDYYLERGRDAEAAATAARAASTGSAAGFTALARLAEHAGRLEDAERLFEQIVERYDSDASLLAFYIRHREDPRFAKHAARALSIVFPEGLRTVSLPELRGQPRGGAAIQGNSAELSAAGLKPADLIVAVDGVLVRNLEQFACARGLSDDRTLTLIVFRRDEGRFLEARANTRLPRRRLGATLGEGGAPRTEQQPVATIQSKDAAAWARVLADPSSPELAEAEAALVKLGTSALPELVRLVETGDAFAQQRALRALWLSAPSLASLPESSLGAISRALSAGAPEVRLQAVALLAVICQIDPGKAPLVGAALGDPDERVRQAALLQLRTSMARSAEHATPALISLLRTGTDQQRVWLLSNLTLLPLPVVAGTAPAVLDLAGSGPAATRRLALAAAAYVARDLAGVTEVFGKALEDPAAEVRGMAINVTQSLGPKAYSLIPALERLVREDPDPVLRQYAEMALRRVRPQ